MITAYWWVVLAGDAPCYSSRDQRVAVIDAHPEVNANCPVENDPDGDAVQAMIVDAYNREIAPDPAVTVADFDFVEPPEGYEWPLPGRSGGA